jgi:hypothetical protein
MAKRSLALAREQGIREYAGAALGNLAWVARDQNNDDKAEQRGREALSCWERREPHALVYPFEWLARLPLLAISLSRDRLTEAVAEARAVLEPRQQHHPHPIASPLAEAVASFDAGSLDGALRHLRISLQAARRSRHA